MTNVARRGLLAVDLGGTRMRIAVFDDERSMRSKSVTPTPEDRPEALTEAMHEILRAADVDIADVVVGVPGPVSYTAGRPVRLPNLERWEGHLLTERLTSEIGLPVVLANDADLAALGEHRYGAGRGVADMLYMTSSTGVGAGVIIGGRLLRAHWSLAEAGHTIIDCATGRTVEDLGSGTALELLAGETGEAVEARARAGDERALAWFREVADAFATGVYNLVHCFMPERVVIGGGMSRSGDLLLGPIRERLDSCDGCPVTGADVVIASAGDDVGLLGAYALWQDIARDPAAPPQP